ncbi:metallophosphoesterase [Desemzia incerta]|uniref:metallophosphoesterase n=1 Tax=Desemzia incerta TaxID=82801 RepID=UPI0024C436C9|nr:metallophosphoesterase [Desemzia incerta]WHZ31990.1 metallophosphoesterase [Desemzia incerta]
MIWIILGLLIVFILLYLYLNNTWLQTTHYSIRIPFLDEELKGTKIVQVSDVHLPKEGVSIQRLLKKVANESPSFIALTGDLIQVDEKFPASKLSQLSTGLAKIAPTYAVTGNHDLKGGHLRDWEQMLSESGVTVLIDEAVWHPINGSGLVLMGLSEKEDFDSAPKPILKEIELTDEQKDEKRILLAHHPEFLEEYLMDLTRVPDLILSGHAHGGQIRLPFFGGLFAPGQGRFPKYTSGVHFDPDLPDKRMVVSRGIGNSTFPFRFNNRPEIVVIELQ